MCDRCVEPHAWDACLAMVCRFSIVSSIYHTRKARCKARHASSCDRDMQVPHKRHKRVGICPGYTSFFLILSPLGAGVFCRSRRKQKGIFVAICPLRHDRLPRYRSRLSPEGDEVCICDDNSIWESSEMCTKNGIECSALWQNRG